MKQVIDVTETVNQAIKYGKAYPCCMCRHEIPRTHGCYAGVKYKGTCKVYMYLKQELLKMREMDEGAEKNGKD